MDSQEPLHPDPPSDRFVLPFSFPVVDATLHDFWAQLLDGADPRHIGRTQLTTGSVEYAMYAGNEDSTWLVGTILIRAVTLEQTYIGAEYGRQDEVNTSRATMTFLLPLIITFIYAHLEAMNREAGYLLRRPVPPTEANLTPDELAEYAQFGLFTAIPPMPDPTIDGWPALFAWDKKDGRRAGVTSDRELARRLGLTHDYVREMRMTHGEPRRKPGRA